MTVHHRKIKQIQFSVTPASGTAVNFECQIRNWTLTPTQDDGQQFFTQCPDGEFIEDAEPNWSLQLDFFSDWKLDGISDFLMAHAGEVATFTLDHHPDLPDVEHVQWTGEVKLKAPPVGGEARSTEQQTVTMQIIGVPVYSRPTTV